MDWIKGFLNRMKKLIKIFLTTEDTENTKKNKEIQKTEKEKIFLTTESTEDLIFKKKI